VVTLFRSGGLLTIEELSNSSAVWFDGVSESWLREGRNNDGFHLPHEPRCSSVFASMFPDDAFMWAERRIFAGQDATIYEVDVPDDAPVFAYRYGLYDDAVRAHARGDDEKWFVDAYWLSGTDVAHWYRMYERMFEGYDFPEQWEVKIPVDVAQASDWRVWRTHDALVEQLNVPVFEDYDNVL